jgi:N-acyl-D-aspartate/D-glutamate deacylase
MEEKIRDPNDFFLNVLARWAKLNVYWVEPTIVTQGSMSGLFTQSYKY